MDRYANDKVLLLDEHFKIIECNERAIKEYQYTREEMIGKAVIELRAPEYAKTIQKKLK
jgi:PAS domain S-box-containing protein